MKNLILAYVVLNVLALILYGIDKLKAINGAYRISEKTLLIIAFLFPVPSILGMKIFRHKIRKIYFVLTALVSLALQIFIYIKFFLY